MHDFKNIKNALDNIANGIDPITGEVFDPRELYNNAYLSRSSKLLNSIIIGRKKPDSVNRLSRPSDIIFEELRKWRLEQSNIEHLPAYYIFSDKELWSIAEGDVCKKEDLLFVNGISNIKFEKYGDDIYEMLLDFIK